MPSDWKQEPCRHTGVDKEAHGGKVWRREREDRWVIKLNPAKEMTQWVKALAGQIWGYEFTSLTHTKTKVRPSFCLYIWGTICMGWRQEDRGGWLAASTAPLQ